MTIEEYFGDWMRVIDKKVLLEAVNKIAILSKTQYICPNMSDVFKAFELCSYHDVKVVFLGQDPYPQKGIATGVLFGNKKEPLSPSLEVIKEACIDYTKAHYGLQFDNSLESWAKQGILMLNSSLTVELDKPGSHSEVWRKFISCLLKQLSEWNPGLIYVLFGKEAQTFKPYIGKLNDVICVQHPAWYARNYEKMPHELFVELTNKIKRQYGETITWFTEY